MFISIEVFAGDGNLHSLVGDFLSSLSFELFTSCWGLLIAFDAFLLKFLLKDDSVTGKEKSESYSNINLSHKSMYSTFFFISSRSILISALDSYFGILDSKIFYC